jgi:hypothetical protein
MTSHRGALIILGLWILAAFASTPAAELSVASVANKPKTAPAGAKPARVYTDADLQKSRGRLTQSQVPQPEPAGPSAAGEPTPGTNADDLASHYYEEFRQQLDWLDRTRVRFEEAERLYSDATGGYVQGWPVPTASASGAGGAVATTTTIGTLSPELWAVAEIHRERMERARRVMDAAEKGLADLRNEARRRGVPAGIYRRAARDWQKDNPDAPAPPP